MKTKQTLYFVTLLVVFCALIFAGYSYFTKNKPGKQKVPSQSVVADNSNADSYDKPSTNLQDTLATGAAGQARSTECKNPKRISTTRLCAR